MPSLALVVVTHNSAAWLAPLAQSWRLAGNSPGDVPTVIADSGSQDDTLRIAEQCFPAAATFRLVNRGFGTAANAAIRQCVADWILLCNPDLTFPPAFGKQILSALSAAPQDVACIAPRLLNPDGTSQPSVGRFPTLGGIIGDQFHPRIRRKYSFPQPTAAGPIDWASGACLLLRREAFLAVGGFDEKYFLYAEEVDLQRRLRDRGQRTWFAPALAVTHHQPNAAREPRPEVQRYAARGLLRYFAKFGGGLAGYRLLALCSGRLPPAEAFSARRAILERSTGP